MSNSTERLPPGVPAATVPGSPAAPAASAAPAPSLDPYTPAQMAERVEAGGVAKASLDAGRTLALGVLAGSFIGLGALLATVAGTATGLGYGPSRLLVGLAFSVGLILVLVGGAELFTGNNLLAIAWADGRVTTRAVLRNWALVFTGNFAGALATAFGVHLSGVYALGGGEVGRTAMSIAAAKVGIPPVEAFFRGVFCNALVCLAVWLSFSARTTTDRILCIGFPVTAFVAIGFEHSIANMYFLPAAMLAAGPSSGIGLADFLVGNLLPVTLGNVVGGSVLVGLVYWYVYLRPRRRPPAAPGAAAILAAGLASLPAAAPAADTWTNIAPGVDWLYRTNGQPNRIHAAFVDLSRPEISLRATKDGENGRKTSSFASLVGAVAAVNGDWFDYDGYRPNGWAVGDGWAWSDRADTDWTGFFACNVTKECWFDTWGTVAPWTPRAWNVVGGSQDRLVVDGVVQAYGGGFYDSDRHPRTAVGMGADGHTLILFVVDGRSDVSIGMTWNEVAAEMGNLGAHQALMFDGGGSSTMFAGGAVRNDPSDGSERVVANHLAVVINPYGTDARCTGIENGKYCLDATRLATCEGGLYEEGDCGYFGLTCEEQGDFAYCVDPRCSAGGQASYCLDGTRIAGCTDGIYGEGDCAAYGANCVAGFGDAWCAADFYQGSPGATSFPSPGDGALTVEEGGAATGWFEVLNTGLDWWEPGLTKLAPIPRDEPSPLADATWESPHRAATVTDPVPPGSVGRFEVVLRAGAEGEYLASFGLVQEGVTWFADPPAGGGPADGVLAVEVRVVAPGAGGDDDDAAGDDGLGGPPETAEGFGGCGCEAGAPAGRGAGAFAVTMAVGLGRRRRAARAAG